MKEHSQSAEMAWLGLGSNKGMMLQLLTQAALDLSVLPGTSLLGVSSVYRSAPLGEGYCQSFLNAVVCLQTRLEPEALLQECLKLEKLAGRDCRQGDRELDIDLLLHGERKVSTASLRIPHPRMLERRFVLEPMLEIDSALTHPVTGKKLSFYLDSESVKNQKLERLTQPLLPAWGC